MTWGAIELEPEVRIRLEGLSDVEFGHAAFYIDLLQERGLLLSEPYTRHLRGKLRELRFHLSGKSVRVTYWIAPGRRMILLTVFAKTRHREGAQIRRAMRAMHVCMEENHILEEGS